MEEKRPEAGPLAPLARRLNMKESQLRAIVYLVLLGMAGVLVVQWDRVGAGQERPVGPATPVAAPRAPGGAGAAVAAPDGLERREAEMADRLEAVLSRIAGVGRVKVTLHLESGPAQVPAMESRATTRTTQEQAQDASRRTTTEREDQSKPVMATNSQPWVLRTDGARVAGVLIVAEGAASARVAEQLSWAARTALKLLPHQVTVLPMQPGGDDQ